VSLFRLVVELLADRLIPFATIGAAALARHGVSRSTFDVDLLTTDPRTLDASLWQDEAIGRAKQARILGADVPVVTAPDLVLLKLYAGGPQDAWDIRQLLDGDGDGSIARTVDSTLGALSADAAALWCRIREG